MIFAVLAHGDDEVIGCGATLTRLVNEGKDVRVAILAKTRVPQDHINRAVTHLGATFWGTLSLPDQRFDTVALLDITRWIETQIRELRPTVVFTHSGADLNQDHRIAAQAVLTACRPVAGCSVTTIYACEVPSSTEWGDGSFHPNTYVDISGTPLLRKVEAMEMYETERRDWPHPRSPKAIRSLAQLRGSHVGLEAAEAFQLIRQIRA